MKGASRGDAAWVVALTLATLLLSIAFDLNERVAEVARRHEAWQLDELPLTLTALAAALAWFAWRRRREVTRLLQRNRLLSRQLIDLQERERRALARELHDEIAQHCTAIRLEAGFAQRARDAGELAASAARSAVAADALHEGVRRLLRRLRPAELDELGLVAALQSLCAAWSAASRLPCRFTQQGELEGLGAEVDTAVYRIAQEALSNVMQHAQATQVDVALSGSASGIVLTVTDDGRGMAPGHGRQGLGLLGAGERAAAVEGHLRIDPAPGGGTRLRLDLPRR